ncbi:MAG TPA: copper resistance protein CopC [Gemmatimonadaceae bacterium]|jgi:copper transport protein|nr:copper resistance protein CopC [Gemmatimonadaceae bacterium]
MRLALLTILSASAALAILPSAKHATLVSSEPAANSRLATAPTQIRLVYSEPIEGKLAKVSLVPASGTPIVLRAGGDPRDVHAVIAPVDALSAGTYKVEWRVVSADGHPVDGSFSFTVGDTTVGTPIAPVAPPQTAQPEPREEAEVWGPAAFGAPLIPAVLRGTGLGALMATVGLLLFMAAAKPNAAQHGDRRLRSVTTAFAVAAPVLLGAHLVTWLINTSPDLKFDPAWAASALGTTVGKIELWRVGLTILALWAWWLARRTRLALLFAAAAVVVSGAVGHSAAIAPAWAVPAKAIHLLASAIWVGGLLWLLIRPAGDDVQLFATDADRVSSRALWAVIAVAFTGVVQTRLFLDSWSGLVTSAYGLLVLAKTAGLLVLVAFGAYNRQRVMPRLTAEPNGTEVGVLRASVTREIVVVAIVILLGGLLAYVPPPNETEAGMSSAAPVPALSQQDTS